MPAKRVAALINRGGAARRAEALGRHLPALCVLAVVFAFGVAGAPDYGLANDQLTQHRVGKFTVEYVLGQSENLLRHNHRYYGAAFEVALLAVERTLGFTDDQHVFLSRYILSHAFFLVGAFACYLLAGRLFRSRLLPMFAMLFFLCHPRLFGHSFFNSKDTPFLSMYLIALLLAHSALRSGSTRAYAGLGAWLGLIGSIRPVAFLLVVLVPLVHIVDFVRGSGRERMRLLMSAGVLASAAIVAVFLALPYVWRDPLPHFAEWLGLMLNHTHVVDSLFLGELISTDDRPWSYVPVWFSITTPPVVTVLALLGAAAFGVRLCRKRHDGRSAAPCGFWFLLAMSVLVPVVVATLLVGNLYNGWRHLYFVYGPVCLFACAGIAWLRETAGDRLASLSVAVAAVGLAPVVCWIALLHPHEHSYFNFLVDRKTPERLRTQFDMNYWAVSHKEALEFLLRTHPDGFIPVAGTVAQSIRVLPKNDRDRIVRSQEFSAYLATDHRYWWGAGVVEGAPYAQPIHVEKVFSNTLYAIVRLQVDDFARTKYAADFSAAVATAPAPVAGGSPVDVHWDGKAITYIIEDCQPADVEGEIFQVGPSQPAGRFFLHVIGDSKRGANRGGYFHNEDFQFRHRGVVFHDGERQVCMARVALDGYVVDALRTGQLNGEEAPFWSVHIRATNPAALASALGRVASRQPQAHGQYRVYVDAGALVYVKEACGEEDRKASFFLHVVPLNRQEATPDVIERGFANRDFTFSTHGTMVGDTCVLRARLPAFQARTAYTGQYVRDRGELWRVDVSLSNGDG